jgi:egghead protein (zeste-white 4 protein)
MFESRNRRKSTFAYFLNRIYVNRQFAFTVGYYLLLVFMTMVGIAYGYYFSEVFFTSDKPFRIEQVMNELKLLWLIPLPYAILNFYSFLRYPITLRPRFQAIPLCPNKRFASTLYFRYVTRGQNPKLVADNVERAYHLLQRILPNQWVVEVVTDIAFSLAIDDPRVKMIVVPDNYETANGTRFKARSLHYALSVSTAQDEDWIIHLDEETRFDEETVRAIYHFAVGECRAVMAGKRPYARIGQGVILYGKGRIVNWLTTLADSIRVGDDYGRFRLQFENGKAYFGMHGSFIVIQNGIEKMIGLDHGPQASITEDAFFALVAQSMGVEFSFIHAFMYEKSPFSVRDFIRQRQRWFGGLWLCVKSPNIPRWERLVLSTFMVLWSISWLCIVMVYVNLLYPTGTPGWLAVSGGISFAYYVTLYLVGFIRTFDWRDGKRRLVLLLIAQLLLLPIFSLMEAIGVFYGLFAPPKNFYVVQKEM